MTFLFWAALRLLKLSCAEQFDVVTDNTSVLTVPALLGDMQAPNKVFKGILADWLT